MRKKSITKENISPRVICTAPWRLSKIQTLPDYEIEVEFNDGMHGVVEMLTLIMSEQAGVFSVLKDKDVFNQAYLEYGALTWPGEIDLAPDAMHDAIKKSGRWILQ